MVKAVFLNDADVVNFGAVRIDIEAGKTNLVPISMQLVHVKPDPGFFSFSFEIAEKLPDASQNTDRTKAIQARMLGKLYAKLWEDDGLHVECAIPDLTTTSGAPNNFIAISLPPTAASLRKLHQVLADICVPEFTVVENKDFNAVWLHLLAEQIEGCAKHIKVNKRDALVKALDPR